MDSLNYVKCTNLIEIQIKWNTNLSEIQIKWNTNLSEIQMEYQFEWNSDQVEYLALLKNKKKNTISIKTLLMC